MRPENTKYQNPTRRVQVKLGYSSVISVHIGISSLQANK